MLAASLIACSILYLAAGSKDAYYGVKIGDLSTLHHQVSGTVYIVDSSRLRIRNFNYDGKGPAALFWIGVKGSSSSEPDKTGIAVQVQNSSANVLSKYVDGDVILALPDTVTVEKVSWLSVWCEQFAINFGHVIFPASITVPRPSVIGHFLNATYGVSSGDVIVDDVRSLTVKQFEFSSNKSLTDVHFVVGNDTSSRENFIKLQPLTDGVKNLEAVQNATNIKLTLLAETQSIVADFQFVAVYSFSRSIILALIDIPTALFVPPSIDKVKQQ